MIFTLFVKVGAHLWMHGKSGDFAPDFFLGLSFLTAAPAFYTLRALGFDPTHISGLLNSFAFACIVNTFCGSLLFGLLATFWQFILKGDNEN